MSHHKRKRGSSTLEFIICAPILLILMYVAMEINERIEQRVTATIATGNLSWLADPSSTNNPGSAAEDLAKADILGTKSASTAGQIGTASGPMLADSSSVFSYSDSKRRADGYVAKITRQANSGVKSTISARSNATIGNSTFDTTTKNLANISSSGANFIDDMTHPGVSWLPQLFPEFIAEQNILSWSLSSTGSDNMALKAITELSETVNNHDTAADLGTFTTKESRILAAKSYILRRDPAFHPDEYQNQSLYGMLVGSTLFNGYVADCFMKFDKNVCSQKNGFYDYVSEIHMAVWTVKTAIDVAKMISCAGPQAAVACAPASIYKEAITQAITQVVDKAVTDNIEKPLEDSIQNEIDSQIQAQTQKIKDKIGSTGDDFEKKVTDKVDQITDSMKAKMTDAINLGEP